MKLGGLLPWEKATGVKNDSVLGVIPRQNEGFWWGILGVFGVVFGIYLDFFAGGFGVGLGHGMGGVTVVLGVVLARLA
ncbi:MAG: hypothetical protein EBQ80_04440, partial [Proteobacteria bacterium]|nr:hypothetical protein [Pseudomonadota bacterium]